MSRPLILVAQVGLVCVTALVAPGIGSLQVDPSGLDSVVKAEMERQRVPGLAVAVVKDGRVVKVAGYGFASVEHRVPVTPETMFQTASVGKQFTAATVMVLVEDGKIALSDPITKYLPEAPKSWRGITIRHLLTHTSGIPDYATETFDLRRDYSENDLVRLAFNLKSEFAPGSRWNYSNTGYVLLGIIVRKASGQFWGDVLRNRVFLPLGMKTARVITEEDIVPNRAAGYRLVHGEIKNQEWINPTLNTTADGSLYVSVLDLIAWDQGLRAKAVLKPQSWEQVFEPVRLNSGRSYPYGFGWQLTEIAGQKVERHGGGPWQGFTCYVARYRGDDLSIVVLANLAQAEPERFVDRIAAVFNPEFAPKEPKPINDREPEITARLQHLLGLAAKGRLRPKDLAYVRAGFFPSVANRYSELLKSLGAPRRVDLLERTELGDDQIYVFEVTYASTTLRVRLGLAPDGTVSVFEIRPQ